MAEETTAAEEEAAVNEEGLAEEEEADEEEAAAAVLVAVDEAESLAGEVPVNGASGLRRVMKKQLGGRGEL